MACVNVSGSASISVMELIMTTVLAELSAAPPVNDDPVAPVGVGGWVCVFRGGGYPAPPGNIYP